MVDFISEPARLRLKSLMRTNEVPDDAARLETMRHSTSHVMAEAVVSLFPGARLGIGPATSEGFYYDFDLPRPLASEDLPAIEAEMKRIAKENCSLALLSRSYEKLQSLVDEIKSDGGIAKAYRCDVAKSEEVKNTFDAIKKDFGKIDIAILNAGISSRLDIRSYSSVIGKEIFEVNTLGIVNCVEQLLPDCYGTKRRNDS